MAGLLNETLKFEVARFRNQHAWSKDFDDREIGEIILALDYVLHYQHGTSGHLGYSVIEKLFALLAES